MGCWETVATNPHAKLEDVLALVGSTGQPAKPRYKEPVDLKAYDLGEFNSMVCFYCYSPAVLLCSVFVLLVPFRSFFVYVFSCMPYVADAA